MAFVQSFVLSSSIKTILIISTFRNNIHYPDGDVAFDYSMFKPDVHTVILCLWTHPQLIIIDHHNSVKTLACVCWKGDPSCVKVWGIVVVSTPEQQSEDLSLISSLTHTIFIQTALFFRRFKTPTNYDRIIAVGNLPSQTAAMNFESAWLNSGIWAK